MKPDLLPHISSPCPKKWDELIGCDKRRFCSECQLHVHNLSAMTARERSDSLRAPGRKCGAYARTPAVRTVSLRRWRFHDRLRPVFAALALLVALFTGGCATTSRKSTDCPTSEHKEVAPVEAGAEGKMTFTVGIIIEERPLWQRILWPWGG